MENFEILSLSDIRKWNKYFSRLPQNQQDVYFTPEYYSLYEKRGDGIAQCLIFENKKGLAIYPFLKNSINNLGYELDKEYYDIQGIYGYNGVIAEYSKSSFLEDLSDTFVDWCNRNQIIAEFVRFNPLLKNHLVSNWITPIDLLDNVFIQLTTFEDIFLNSFHQKVREAIRKAERYGLTYLSFSGGEITDDFLHHFLDIYEHMLRRNNVDKYYYYSIEHFQQMRNILPNNTLFSFAIFNDTPISTELIIHNKVNAYAYLGGTLSEYYNKSPNTYIRSEILKDLLTKGIKYYNMGGGILRNDSLFKYKQSFSKSISSTFYIGKRIHNQEIYQKVIELWEQRFPEKKEKYKGLFLKYRY